jgi:hypothetical protein
MTAVEILFRYTAEPTEAVSSALARAREVYGIRQLNLDPNARTLRVEYDATRLNAAAVAKLIRQAGLEIELEIEAEPPPLPPKLPPAA